MTRTLLSLVILFSAACSGGGSRKAKGARCKAGYRPDLVVTLEKKGTQKSLAKVSESAKDGLPVGNYAYSGAEILYSRIIKNGKKEGVDREIFIHVAETKKRDGTLSFDNPVCVRDLEPGKAIEPVVAAGIVKMSVSDSQDAIDYAAGQFELSFDGKLIHTKEQAPLGEGADPKEFFAKLKANMVTYQYKNYFFIKSTIEEPLKSVDGKDTTESLTTIIRFEHQAP